LKPSHASLFSGYLSHQPWVGDLALITTVLKGAQSPTQPHINVFIYRHSFLSFLYTIIAVMNWEQFTFNACAFASACFLLEWGADQFIDHTVVVARRLRVSPALVSLLTAGAEWEEVSIQLTRK
jgi:hypothetical protein